MPDVTENTIVVENSAELMKALATFSGSSGGTILMKNTGTAYKASLSDAGENEPQIIITSFDPDDPAVIEQLTINGRENITVDNVVFDSSEAEFERSHYIRDLEVRNSTDITVKNSVFKSYAENMLISADAEARVTSMGIVRNSEDFTFSNNDVSGYIYGLAVFETKGLVIEKNEFSKIQADGMQFGGVQDVLIEDNYMHDFLGSLQTLNHDDMIQFWGTNATLRTENVIIRGNILDASNGSGAQAIFGRNEGYETEDDLYQNILIEDNVIHNSSYHGITMYDTNGLTIRNNTVLWNEDATIHSTLDITGSYVPRIGSVNSLNVEIYGNIAPAIFAPDGVDVSNNAIITYNDKMADGYVEKHFVNAFVGGDGDLRDLKLLPDSEWTGLFGSKHSQATATADNLTSVMTIQEVKGDLNSFVFSAALSQDETGYLDDGEAIFTWQFSDGTTMTGISVVKKFEDVGENGVSLTVTSDDTDGAAIDSITRGVVVRDKNLVALDFDGGVKDGSSYNSLISTTGGSTVAGLSGDGFVLDGTSLVHIGRHNDHILGLDFFSLGLAVKLDPTSEGNTFLNFHQSMYGAIEDDGSVIFTIATLDEVFTVTSVAGLISDTDWHKIDVTYDSANEALVLYVDGKAADEIQASGQMKTQTYWNMDLGGTWGGSIKGVIDNFSLTADTKTASEIAEDYRELGISPDYITSSGEDITLKGDSTNNTYIVTGEDGASDFWVKIKGNKGSDEIIVEDGRSVIRGNAGKDFITLGDAEDVAFGGKHNDIIFGGAGADRLVGNRGNDELYGGLGNDKLVGSAGNDIMTGGANADTFIFNGRRDQGSDTITDFNSEQDLIRITKGHDFSDVTIDSYGLDTLLSLSSGTKIALLGVEASTIDIDNFDFI